MQLSLPPRRSTFPVFAPRWRKRAISACRLRLACLWVSLTSTFFRSENLDDTFSIWRAENMRTRSTPEVRIGVMPIEQDGTTFKPLLKARRILALIVVMNQAKGRGKEAGRADRKWIDVLSRRMWNWSKSAGRCLFLPPLNISPMIGFMARRC